MQRGLTSPWRTVLVGLSTAISPHITLASDPLQNQIDNTVARVENIVSDSSRGNTDLLTKLGTGGMVLLILGGSVLGSRYIMKLNSRETIKKEIETATTRFMKIVGHIPESYVHTHDKLAMIAKNSLSSYTKQDIDNILKGGRAKVVYDRYILALSDKPLKNLEHLYQNAKKELNDKLNTAFTERKRLYDLQNKARQSGYKLSENMVHIPDRDDHADPDKTIKEITNTLGKMKDQIHTLSHIDEEYAGWQEAKHDPQKVWSDEKSRLQEINIDFESICDGTPNGKQWRDIGKQAELFSQAFLLVYSQKNIEELRQLAIQKLELVNEIRYISYLLQLDIDWYESIPSLISQKKTLLQTLEKDLLSGAIPIEQENFGTNLKKLSQLIIRIQDTYRQKSSMGAIAANFSDFTDIYNEIIKHYPAQASHTETVPGGEGVYDSGDFQPTVPMEKWAEI